MAKIYDMKQERAKLTASIRELMDKYDDKEITAEDKVILEKLEGDFDILNAKITTEEKQLDRERAAGEIEDKLQNKDKLKDNLFARALSGNMTHMQEYRNSMDLGIDTQSGNLTAPMEFVQELIKGLDNILFMRNIAKTIGPIGAAQSLGFPYRITEAGDVTWSGEIVAAGEETTVTYGRREFKPQKLAKLVKLSRTLMQHAPMAESTILNEILYRLSAAQENAYMSGDGVAKPLGIFTASADGISTVRDVSAGNTATTVTFDGLIEAKYSLKEQYLRGAEWVMHRNLAKMLAKIKDKDDQYIWQPSVALGQPDLLLGKPTHMSEYAPNTYATGLYAAVLGNFRLGYWICDANNVNIQVLNELYAVTNQIGYIVDYFGDGAPVINEAFARVKMG